VYHTAFLLRTPARKREAWRDMLEIRRRLREESTSP
jgi:uracil-DNA glycosylase